MSPSSFFAFGFDAPPLRTIAAREKRLDAMPETIVKFEGNRRIKAAGEREIRKRRNGFASQRSPFAPFPLFVGCLRITAVDEPGTKERGTAPGTGPILRSVPPPSIDSLGSGDRNLGRMEAWPIIR